MTPPLDDLLDRLHVVALPMRVRFRGIMTREVALIDGPAGWGEFSAFLEYDPPEAAAGFAGAERRFERTGIAAGVEVFDDYSHHPTEIEAVLRAARTERTGRIIVAFQPHSYSRTRQLRGDSARARQALVGR